MVFEPELVYETKSRTPNIQPEFFEKLTSAFGKTPSPEEILYYIYAVFYSAIYRTKYAEFLRIDFPRVPFTSNYDLFSKMAALGNQLANLHLLKIEAFDALISKYQGEGANNSVEKVIYNENEQRVYINPQKYFDNVSTELWNYHIGGYQILKKYLDDRAKAQRDIGDEKTFCRIITSIAKTIELQKTIDELYPLVEKDLL
jgi:predicted helicase